MELCGDVNIHTQNVCEYVKPPNEENNKSKLLQPNDCGSENQYFSLDLRIPKNSSYPSFVRTPKCTAPEKLTCTKLLKFGFVNQLETIFNKNLRMNNPWFNSEALNSYFEKRPKKVRIKTTEILADTPQLPNCRRNGSSVKPGQLHATSCKNAAQETLDIIGDHAYQNRQFIIQYLEERVHADTIKANTSRVEPL